MRVLNYAVLMEVRRGQIKLSSSIFGLVIIVKQPKFLLLNFCWFFYVLLTAHLSVTLVNDQLDAQFFYFIIRLLQSSTCFEQRRTHHQEVKFY